MGWNGIDQVMDRRKNWVGHYSALCTYLSILLHQLSIPTTLPSGIPSLISRLSRE